MNGPVMHQGFQVIGNGPRYLLSVGRVDSIGGVPTGAKVRLRLRPDDFATAFVRFGASLSHHVLCLDSADRIVLGPELARNVASVQTRVDSP